MQDSEKEKELETWIDSYSAELYKRAFYLLQDKEEAEDMVQEVFIAAYHGMDGFERKSSPLTWLKAILNNKSAEFYRKKYKTGTQVSLDDFFNKEEFWVNTGFLDSWTDPEETSLLDNNSFNESLEKCLEQLPQKWLMLIKLSYLEQKKFPEICQEVDISATNYWKILQRSRLQLRECLELNWFNKK